MSDFQYRPLNMLDLLTPQQQQLLATDPKQLNRLQLSGIESRAFLLDVLSRRPELTDDEAERVLGHTLASQLECTVCEKYKQTVLVCDQRDLPDGHIDPWKPNITESEKATVLAECLADPWYFLTQVVRTKASFKICQQCLGQMDKQFPVDRRKK